MKRTAAAMMMVAGLGGCVSPDKNTPAAGSFGQASKTRDAAGLVGPNGKPVAVAAGTTAAATTAKAAKAGGTAGTVVTGPAAVVPITGAVVGSADAVTSAGHARVIGSAAPTGGCADGSCGAAVPGGATVAGGTVIDGGVVTANGGHFGHGGHLGHGGLGSRLNGIGNGGHLGDGRGGHGHGGYGGGDGYTVSPYGPQAHGLQLAMGRAGIMPAPAMGPYGAVAAVGAYGPGAGAGPMYANQRTSVRFVSPQDMRIAWQSAGGGFSDGTPLQAPARYNFLQGSVYRLKLSQVPNRPGLELYPTLEVYPATPRTVTYLSHNAVPVGFTDEDFDQVRSGNLVVKVVYLPFDAYQDQAAVAGADEVVSTRLEPGIDPIAEANQRGTILAVVRLGNIDLEDRNSPAMTAPPGTVGAPAPAPTFAAPPAGVILGPMSAAPKTPAAMPVVTTPAPVPAPLPNATKTPVPALPTSLPLGK